MHGSITVIGHDSFVRFRKRSCPRRHESDWPLPLCTASYAVMWREVELIRKEESSAAISLCVGLPSVAIEDQHSGQLAAMQDQYIATTRWVQYQEQTDCGICKSVR